MLAPQASCPSLSPFLASQLNVFIFSEAVLGTALKYCIMLLILHAVCNWLITTPANESILNNPKKIQYPTQFYRNVLSTVD